ncbi:hypothetical protein PENTCL1PPCAC_4018, partial [Pristionchus entomophagus]
LFLLLHSFPSLMCSCFVESPWENIRPVLRMTYPCPAIDACESTCLGAPECSAYAFVNSKCALLGADSGKSQTCNTANPTLWLRTAACDESTTTTSSISTTTQPFK